MAKYTEAKKEGNKRWDSQNLDRISIALPKGSREAIRDHIAGFGYDSVNSFIKHSIYKQMERDKENR